MVPEVIRFIPASAGLIVLLPTGVVAQGPAEPPTMKAQMAGVSFCFGNTHIGQGARMTVGDVTNGSSGVSAEFRPQFVVGGRLEVYRDHHYSFDRFGIQDAPFPTTTVTVSGSCWSFVFGAGFGW
jgi:hypothetical protein